MWPSRYFCVGPVVKLELVLSQRLLVTKRRNGDWCDSKEQGLGSRPGQRFKSKVPKGLSEAR